MEMAACRERLREAERQAEEEKAESRAAAQFEAFDSGLIAGMFEEEDDDDWEWEAIHDMGHSNGQLRFFVEWTQTH